MLTDNNSNGMVMPVQPMGGYSGGSFGVPYAVPTFGGDGFGGGDWGSLIVLFLIAAMFGGFGGGFGGFGGNQLGYDFPWLLTGQQNVNSNTNEGFRDVILNDGITSIKDGINGISTQLCNGFAGVEQGANTRQIANMQSDFALQNTINQGFNSTQAQLAQCCCDNRLATNDLKYTIATEACNSRANSIANTQAILDKLCQLELDGYKRENDNLRSQLNMATLRESQTAQNAFIAQGFSNEVDQLYNRLNSCPVPSTPVYGRTPIFTCNQNNGCGCGCGNNFGGFNGNF